jgi:hypothetical protein
MTCKNSDIVNITAAVKFLWTGIVQCIIAATFQYCCHMYPATFCWIYCLCPSVAHILKDDVCFYMYMINTKFFKKYSRETWFLLLRWILCSNFSSSYNIFETVVITFSSNFFYLVGQFCFWIWNDMCAIITPFHAESHSNLTVLL